MTVKELIKELKAMPQDAEVAIVNDWENCDEYGNMPVDTVTGVTTQHYIDCQGLGDRETIDVIFLI
ncbi:MAG: hypothetical protein PHR53_02525 [Bacteroidales bacterium]|nr:hypothetical protein [Bacteroidales bacterium]